MIAKKEFLRLVGFNNKIAIERLTALWALNECGLGGVMHAFKLPFTGILVGGVSVLLITLIALFATKIGPALIKALTIVLLVKLAVSPYTPITAYFAVSFQAFLGIILYRLFSINNWSIVVLCVVTFLESALQKLLTLTILFGQALWSAIDSYMGWIENQLFFMPIQLSSNTLIFTFLGVYTLSGIVTGFFIIRTIKLIQREDFSIMNLELKTATVESTFNEKKSGKKTFYIFLIVLFLILLSIIYLSTDSHPWQNALYLFFRSVLILIIWYFLIGPLLIKLLNRILSKKRKSYQVDLMDILIILPLLRAIVLRSWKESRSYKGIKKLPYFLAKSITYSLCFENIKQ